MSVYEYDGKTKVGPSGFVGLRLTVMVDGKRVQEYYSFKTGKGNGEMLPPESIAEIRERVERRHEDLMVQKERAKSRRALLARQGTCDPLHSTGVKGIILTLQVKQRNGKTWYTPMFQVNVAEGHGSIYIKKPYRRHFSFAWKNAVERYAELKHLDSYDHLLKRRPVHPVSRIDLLHKHFRSKYEEPVVAR